MNTLLTALNVIIENGHGDKPLRGEVQYSHSVRTGAHNHSSILFPDGSYKAVYEEQDGPGWPWINGGDVAELGYYNAMHPNFPLGKTSAQLLPEATQRLERELNPQQWVSTRTISPAEPGTVIIGTVYQREGQPNSPCYNYDGSVFSTPAYVNFGSHVVTVE